MQEDDDWCGMISAACRSVVVWRSKLQLTYGTYSSYNPVQPAGVPVRYRVLD